MDNKSEYLKRAQRLEAQAKAIGDPAARGMMQALIDSLYLAADSGAATCEAGPGSAGSADPAAVAEVADAASRFRRVADRLRRQIAVTVDPEIVDQLGSLVDEYDLLAAVVEGLAGKSE